MFSVKKKSDVSFLRCGLGIISSLIPLGLVESPGLEAICLDTSLSFMELSYPWSFGYMLVSGTAVIILYSKGKYRKYSGFWLNRSFPDRKSVV